MGVMSMARKIARIYKICSKSTHNEKTIFNVLYKSKAWQEGQAPAWELTLSSC